MADKRKSRKRREEVDEKPSKDEYAVAKYLRSHLPAKKTSLLSHKVEYFIASKAVDCLLDSPWASNKGKRETFFSTRESVVEYLNTMLIHKFFHRAKKILVSQKDTKLKKKSSKEREQEKTKETQPDDKKPSSSSGSKKKEKTNAKEKEKEKESEVKKQDSDATKKKEKRKIKLDMHLEQIFVDGNEAYVWIYDPIPTTAWLIGSLLVVGAILLCLFPLWPSSVRKGVYYISVAAAGFLCVIVALIIVRVIIFCVVWMLTFGKHHLWILPNLTEDVGFFESFWPLFKYEYKGNEEENKSDGDDKEKNTIEKNGKSHEKDSDRDPTETEESEESGEHQQATNDSNGAENGFEIVDRGDLEQSTCRDRKANIKREASS